MLKLTWPRVAAWRIRRHHLYTRAPAQNMLAVTSRICGLHAQVLSSAELTLWARIENLDRRAVQRALWEERTLVKTWAMRGTLHLLPAAELSLWHAALRSTARYTPAFWQRVFGLSVEEVDQLTQAVAAALDGRVMTREELAQEVRRLTGSANIGTQLAESNWGTILKPAAFCGHLCFAPSLGQRVRFTRPQSWLATKSSAVDPESAPLEITRRFLAAYGPATYRDLARWWGSGGVATARQRIAALGDEVSPVELNGAQAWMLTAHLRELREISPGKSVSLLPAFDHYVVGVSAHAQHLTPGDFRARIYRPQGWISPVLLVNGLMQGTWRHEIKGSRVEVAIEPFVQQPAWVRRAAEQEAERLAEFFGAKLSLKWR